MKNESVGMDYSKLEKQLHDDFQHLDEEELNDHLKAKKKTECIHPETNIR